LLPVVEEEDLILVAAVVLVDFKPTFLDTREHILHFPYQPLLENIQSL
tara:strand:+ start:247 stop:390 length:144 start_codon:yes stop_codon:yes gene_type:complete